MTCQERPPGEGWDTDKSGRPREEWEPQKPKDKPGGMFPLPVKLEKNGSRNKAPVSYPIQATQEAPMNPTLLNPMKLIQGLQS